VRILPCTGEWRVLQGLDEAPSHGVVAAARRVAAVFARYVRLHTAPGSFSLVQDGKLLHVASALLALPAPVEDASQQEPACACAAGAWVGRVVVALADPLDTMLAQVGCSTFSVWCYFRPRLPPLATRFRACILHLRVLVLSIEYVRSTLFRRALI
jgi:hypothetical protein